LEKIVENHNVLKILAEQGEEKKEQVDKNSNYSSEDKPYISGS
jgi:hypothetical protein